MHILQKIIIWLIVGTIIAEGHHQIQLVNNSLFPVYLSNINRICINNTSLSNNVTIEAGQNLTINITDKNSGLECFNTNKSLSFNLVSKTFNDNPSGGDTSTVNLSFSHTTDNKLHWYSTFWSAPRNSNNFNISCLRDPNNPSSWSNCYNGNNVYTNDTKARVQITNSTAWNYNFNGNMQIVNLSSVPLHFTNNDNLINCHNAPTISQTLLSGMQTKFYNLNMNSSENSMSSICSFNISSNAFIGETQDFGIALYYPNKYFNYLGNFTQNNLIECINDDPTVNSINQISYLAVSNTKACFIGCQEANINNKYTQNHQKVIHKYQYNYRKPLPDNHLIAIPNGRNFNVITSSNKYNIALQCHDANYLNIKTLNPKRIKNKHNFWVSPYLLSPNKQYYFFCAVGNSSDHRLELRIMNAKNNILIAKDSILYTADNGYLIMAQNGIFYYTDEERYRYYPLNKQTVWTDRHLPTTVRLTDAGSFMYTGHNNDIFRILK